MFRPMRTMACVGKCRTNDDCPSPDQDAAEMDDRMPQECRQCLQTECGKYIDVE